MPLVITNEFLEVQYAPNSNELTITHKATHRTFLTANFNATAARRSLAVFASDNKFGMGQSH